MLLRKKMSKMLKVLVRKKVINVMVFASSNLAAGTFTLEITKTTKNMAMVTISLKMVWYIEENMKMIKRLMEKSSIQNQARLSTREDGALTPIMAMANSTESAGSIIMVIFKRENSMAKVNSVGPMATTTKVIWSMVLEKAMVFSNT